MSILVVRQTTAKGESELYLVSNLSNRGYQLEPVPWGDMVNYGFYAQGRGRYVFKPIMSREEDNQIRRRCATFGEVGVYQKFNKQRVLDLFPIDPHQYQVGGFFAWTLRYTDALYVIDWDMPVIDWVEGALAGDPRLLEPGLWGKPVSEVFEVVDEVVEVVEARERDDMALLDEILERGRDPEKEVAYQRNRAKGLPGSAKPEVVVDEIKIPKPVRKGVPDPRFDGSHI